MPPDPVGRRWHQVLAQPGGPGLPLCHRPGAPTQAGEWSPLPVGTPAGAPCSSPPAAGAVGPAMPPPTCARCRGVPMHANDAPPCPLPAPNAPRSARSPLGNSGKRRRGKTKKSPLQRVPRSKPKPKPRPKPEPNPAQLSTPTCPPRRSDCCRMLWGPHRPHPAVQAGGASPAYQPKHAAL